MECITLVLGLAVLLAIKPVIKMAVFAALLLKKEPSQIPRKNFSRSSKAMESSVCEELFQKEQYKVMVTDEESQVNPDVEKWSDINHVVRILGNVLYEAKTTNFGPKNDRLTDKVRDNIVKSFGIAERMQLAITSIVPHALVSMKAVENGVKFMKIQRHIGANIFREEKICEAERMQLAITSIVPHALVSMKAVENGVKFMKIQRHIGANIFREEKIFKGMV